MINNKDVVSGIVCLLAIILLFWGGVAIERHKDATLKQTIRDAVFQAILYKEQLNDKGEK
jgi:hypothetical protein